MLIICIALVSNIYAIVISKKVNVFYFIMITVFFFFLRKFQLPGNLRQNVVQYFVSIAGSFFFREFIVPEKSFQHSLLCLDYSFFYQFVPTIDDCMTK